MVGCENISGKLSLDREIIKKCFQQALNGLETKKNQLNSISESVAESSKMLVFMGETIEDKLKQVQQKEIDLHVFQEKGFKELELNVIHEVLATQELLKEQEKMIEDFFEKMELKRKQFETAQNAVDDRFIDICLKEGTVNLIKIQNDNRSTELDKREEGLARREKDIELRDAVLLSRNVELIAKENVLGAREKIMDLKKELGLKQKELDSVENPTPSEELRKKSRKALTNSAENAKSSKRTKKVQTSAHADSHSVSADNNSSDEMGQNQ